VPWRVADPLRVSTPFAGLAAGVQPALSQQHPGCAAPLQIHEQLLEWGIDYWDNCLVPLDNYVSRGTEVFLGCKSPDYLASTYQVGWAGAAPGQRLGSAWGSQTRGWRGSGAPLLAAAGHCWAAPLAPLPCCAG
jgi:hypothetical protein